MALKVVDRDGDPPSFADAPQSFTERRSDMVEEGGKVWTPRDALIRALREIDSGQINPSVLVVCMLDQEAKVTFKQASPSIYQTLGVMEACKALMLQD